MSQHAEPGVEAVHQAGHFEFEQGGAVPDMKVGYVTWGRLNADKSNAILLVPGTSRGRHNYDHHIGPGKTFDTDRYFVIGADAIGGGTSSSPADGLGAAFPRYTIRDMVRAQHDLVTKGLGISRLYAAGGGSMGSFQTMEWGINYPDAMRGLIMIVPAARSDNHFAALVDAMEATVTLDPAWMGGAYRDNPVEGLRRAALIYFPWTGTDEYLLTLDRAAYEAAKKRAGDRWADHWDAVSLLWRYHASRGHDVSVPFGGDMKAALGRIEAESLLLPAVLDRTIPPYLSRELHGGLRKRAIWAEIPSILGHMAGGAAAGTPEYAFISAHIQRFLDSLR